MTASRKSYSSSMNLALRVGLAVGLPVLGLGLFFRALAPAAAAPPTAPEAALMFEPFYLELTSSGANAARTGDVDGDGDLEIVIARSDGVSVYNNSGGGVFARTDSPLELGGYYHGLALGDVDGDGDLDTVAGGQNGLDKILLNDGAGEFRTIRDFGYNFSRTDGLALGDMDGDGDLDIVAGDNYDGFVPQQSAVYLNDGAGNFFTGAFTCGVTTGVECFGDPADDTTDIALADIEADGDVDIVVGRTGQQSAAYLNDGAGNFHTGAFTCGVTATVRCFGGATDDTRSVSVGDVDGDGDTDVASGNYNTTSQVHLNTGSGFSSVALTSAFSTLDVTLGDLDGDGDLDIARGRYDTPTEIHWNDGAGSFTTSLTIGGDLRSYLAVADVDGDHDLDMVQANDGYPSLVFRNNGGGGLGQAVNIGNTPDDTKSVALGDVDSDGDVDAVLGNEGAQSAVLLNNGAGGFFILAINCVIPDVRCFGSAGAQTIGVAVGDLNGDRHLDLVAGRRNEQSAAYLNNGNGFFLTTRNFGPASGLTTTVALGDVDGDGDLDIVAGNYLGQGRVYLNDGSANFGSTRDFGPPTDPTRSVAVGDLDGDGDLDIVVGNEDQFLGDDTLNAIYLNDGAGNFTTSRSFGQGQGAWELTGHVAMGDLDSDGDLDIVTANNFLGLSLFYLNDGAANFNWPGSAQPYGPPNTIFGVAVGDVDGDGDVDIATSEVDKTGLYLNNGTGQFTEGRSLSLPLYDNLSVALGDLNGDGAQDVVMGRSASSTDQAYYFDRALTPLNQPPSASKLRIAPLQNGNFNYTNPGVRSATVPLTYTLNDAEGNRSSVRAFYSPDGGGQWYPALAAGGTLTANLPTTATYTYNWDVFASGFFGASDNVVVRLESYRYPALATAFAVTGTYRYTDAVAGPYQFPNLVAQTPPFRVRGTQIRVLNGATPVANAIVYRLPAGQVSGAEPFADGSGQPFRTDAQGFLQGRGQINPGDGLVALLPVLGSTINTYASADVPKAIADTGTPVVTSTLTITAGGAIQDLNVVNLNGLHTWFGDLSFVLQSPSGTQVEIMAQSCGDDDNFNLNLDDEATPGPWPCPPNDGGTYQPSNPLSAFDGENSTGTWMLIVNDNADQDGGSLEGWGLAIATPGGAGDYEVYYTSAAPTPIGLAFTPATASGVQTLTVSSANPLILFDIKVSLEWDARNDPEFLATLQNDLYRTSELLYDWTDGRMALGDVTIYHDREHWDDAHVRLYGTNGLHPNADQGGVTRSTISETVTSNNIPPITRTLYYVPGQVRMAAVWSRFGGGGSLGEDWPRTLAHELSHYLLYLDDSYLGLKDSGQFFQLSACAGTAMTDPYRDDFSEFIFNTAYWDTNCFETFAARTTDRTEWETLERFYPNLPAPANPGPALLPLAVTQLNFVEPVSPTQALPVPIYYLTFNSGRAVPDPEARAILFQPTRNRLIDLGHPIEDRVTAYGAQAGDTLCVYDIALHRDGCATLSAGDTQLALVDRINWQPDIVVAPVTSRTVNIQVSNIPGGLALRAKVYPHSYIASPILTFVESGGLYSTTVVLTNPTTSAYVHVWVNADPAPRREAIIDYTLGGNPAPPTRRSPRRAPVTSNNGELTLYNDIELFPPGEFYTLQPATRLPNVPTWLSVVGRGYRLLASAGAPPLSGAYLSFNYDAASVPPGEEAFLQVYYYSATVSTWLPITTTLGGGEGGGGSAIAPVQNVGLYALMSSFNIPLYGPGWNLFAYPVQVTRPVTEALLSISGSYTTVYGYVFTDTLDPWRIYDVTLPPQLNDLTVLEFGKGYWINVSEDLILRLKGSGATLAAPENLESFGSPPDTYYGQVFGSGVFTPTVGMTVVAYVGGTPCGQGTTQLVSGQLMYLVKVWAEGPGSSNGCGAPGRTVTFSVGGQAMFQSAPWDNGQVHLLNLAPSVVNSLYLPVLRR